VYLLIRFFDLLKFSGVLNILLFLGIITIFISGIRAIFEFDFKKIIALSTLRQLGLIVTTLGLGFKYLRFFHLLTHAFFKALLFLCAGLLIHRFFNFQDIRYIGGLIKYIPITFSCFMISNLSLIGIFFISGFYSKDLILELISFRCLNFFIYILFYFCIILTIFYSLRLIFIRYINYNNFFILIEFHDEDYFMIIGIMTLILIRIFSGSIMK
jgi:NADH-ubiquinone oxidoreductase chain 5